MPTAVLLPSKCLMHKLTTLQNHGGKQQRRYVMSYTLNFTTAYSMKNSVEK